jgi:hypothetical protein
LNLGGDVAASVEDREVFLPWDATAQDLLLLGCALGLRLGVGINFDLACEFSSLFSSPI